MLYRVLMDGADILDFTDKSLVLLSPQVTMEIDTAGSFEFTVPPNHLFYDDFQPETIMKMMIEVWEGDILHFFGRPVELHLDFYKNKKVYCEGALSFFNDSVIREAEYDDQTLSDIFALVIAEHNSMVPANRHFTVGSFTVTNNVVYRKFNYEQTADVLKSKFLDAVEGHFFLRRENDTNYIDFLKDMPYTCNQNVEFAENLLNFTYSFDGKDFATCVIPLGGNDPDTGLPLDIKSVNNGSDILVGATAGNYGHIVKVQQYSDIKEADKLVAEGQKYLSDLQWNAFLIECSAVDLHATDETKQQFRVGQVVHCVSSPHGVSLDLPISKMTIYLDSAAKQITLGRIPRKTLSRFYKENISGGGGGGGIGEDDVLPEGYGIIDDPITGEPTLIKVPVTMQIMTLPYRDGSQENSTYEYGDTLVFNGLTAKLVGKGQSSSDDPSAPITYFSDANYPTGDIPFNELRFEPTTYNQHKGKIMCWAIWTNPNGLYNGYTTRKPFYMYSLTEKALEDADLPVRIEIVTPPAQLEYFTGGYIHMSGAKVVAYRENGDPYDTESYPGGVIPLSELVLVPPKADSEQETMEIEADEDVLAAYGRSEGGIPLTNVSYSGSSNYGRNPFTGSIVASSGGIFYVIEQSSRYYFLAVGEEPFTITYSGGKYNTPTTVINTVERTSGYSGKTYYTNAGWEELFAFNTGDSYDPGFIGPNRYDSITRNGWWRITGWQEIADITFYHSRITEGQTIKVQWTPPGSDTPLETSFVITIKESEHGR